ncbi:lysoplasmalogenase family protein [Anaerotignum sp.]|uniref:lysoplasmalogenase family protein n=1 Tax=Anaerotignum sp. TaxID=2039241 RepID=UPI003FA4C3BB
MDKTDYIVLFSFLILYFFITFWAQSPYINFVRFLVICLCLIPAFRHGVFGAAFFTVISDCFLLFTPYYKIGVYFFCLVQLCYINFFSDKKPPILLFFFSLLLLVLPLPVMGGIYAFLFFIHAFLAFSLWKQKKAEPFCGLYLLGLILFICCDTLVAIGYFTAPQPILIWIFYGPSQLILAFSARTLQSQSKPFVPYP